jgi:hypothetical protein
MRALARSRLLHFLLIGGALFAAERALATRDGRTGGEVVVGAARIREVVDDYRRATGRTPTDDERRILVARAIDEELLYREAVARGLDRDDRSIRWQLVEKMAFLDGQDPYTADRDALHRRALEAGLGDDDPVIRRMLVEKLRLLVKEETAREPVAEAELRDWVAGHRDRFAVPARVSFWHVFLARATHPALDADGMRLLARLRAADTAPDAAAELGDGFPLPVHVKAQSAGQLERAFGADFAAAVARAPVGAWSGPIPSAYGTHVVWMEGTEPAGPAPLDAVRDRALVALRGERAAARLAELLARLRREHPVRVEG